MIRLFADEEFQDLASSGDKPEKPRGLPASPRADLAWSSAYPSQVVEQKRQVEEVLPPCLRR